MPQVRAERFIRIDPETAFAFSQTTGDLRLKRELMAEFKAL
ncbi:hypothetical protein J2X98_000461 [Pseudarthrobacter enclensis]|uniref:Uncharacterized protein n=1 Tax=Pseudarthrobacter enclensis TaxID=993070 RepID=A0ABT9RNT8_9MICC|nr:hypothetical protein [Pseudarthrobacter enclensis]